MFPIFDPIAFGLYLLGYIVMIIVAVVIAPKVASSISGRFTLYGAMALTAVLIVLTTAFVIYLIAIVAAPALAEYGWGFILGMIFFVVLMNLITYIASPFLINVTYGARPDPRLQEIVDAVASRLGAPFRIKAVVVDGPPNAFAYGNFLTGRYVAVTSSMLALTDKRELEAVIGHEIGHHLHRDNALMLLFGVLPSILYYLGVSSVRIALSSSNNRNNNTMLLAAVGILAVVVSFLVQLLVLAFSRLREYYADTAGAKAAGKEAMQFALAKIHKFYFSNPEAHEIISGDKFRALFIYALVNAVANPFITVTRSEIEEIKRSSYSVIQEIFSTHPPIPKRLRFLDQLQI
ncbi:Heat shock protein, Metallo peptidase, MEROPS family M48B [Pyrobaculum islandicum DSM 4184]|uniref:Protease HtpX homolog n=1 Tax=Pyrobaculum islandicum (strain DSM 4184 / JCM 9189 / GEO3) TaxID=384616 RepID=HTPX_PYRIL|nr:zinc metalloprotease HtpX [Pyrobaculum islandicum]A1RT82.1 RecName: Full=Protease HtpX homolog [Pyrobaculum islandicum DSM 4184]ABL88164.1 Heat shock protein, Metallo peptidase, MEROPS family M48B [Pyrobaculum islandicum DSM 4184]